MFSSINFLIYYSVGERFQKILCRQGKLSVKSVGLIRSEYFALVDFGSELLCLESDFLIGPIRFKSDQYIEPVKIKNFNKNVFNACWISKKRRVHISGSGFRPIATQDFFVSKEIYHKIFLYDFV